MLWKHKQLRCNASEHGDVDGNHFVHAKNKRCGNAVLIRAQWDRCEVTVVAQLGLLQRCEVAVAAQ